MCGQAFDALLVPCLTVAWRPARIRHVNVHERRSLRKLSHFGSKGSGATTGPGEFKLVHSIGSDSQGNLFVTETGGMPCRVQKFRLVG